MSDYCIEKLEGFFPEIIESEDERIKREILEFVSISGNGNQFEEIKNWLGKQGKQKPEEWCFPYNVNETVDKLMAIAECLEMDEDFLYNGYTGTECVKFLRDLARKQVECKPTDEIKPKFKVGDWITNGEYTWKVTDIKPLDYILQSQAGSIVCDDIFYVDEHFHLWTIQDAKDGDVLQLQHEGIEHVIVYKRLVKKNFHTILSIHCAYDGSTNDFFEDTDSYHCITSERDEKEIHPATKEQRELLFSKMKEAGYEWDSEKKELKKIEQESTWNEKIKGLNELETYIFSLVPDRSLNAIKVDTKNIRYIINKEQNPTWNEEDERMIDTIIYDLERHGGKEDSCYSAEINWLKSIKS